ncbi:MAG: CDP-glycerol--glycerophosphate glycerophosphotransferase, partial [Planctomycetota bacterium]
MGRFLFYIEQPYSYSILRPLQEEIRSRGDSAAWFLAGKHVSRDQLKSDELHLESVRAVREFDPQAVFVPGNVVPDFFPGLKVQVFHGLEWKKKGHFAIRGFFDLYCTHGPITTERFDQLAERHRSFRVIETGWPKLDPYLGQPEDGASTPPTVVYAPTFSPSLSSASALLPELTRLARAGRFRFQVKFHPKMERSVVEAYRGAAGEGLEIA